MATLPTFSIQPSYPSLPAQLFAVRVAVSSAVRERGASVVHGCDASLHSSTHQLPPSSPSNHPSRRCLLASPQWVPPLAMTFVSVVQVVFTVAVHFFYSSTHQLPPPSPSNHPTRHCILASPRCIPPLAVTFVSVGSKRPCLMVDKIIDVIVMEKDELELRHELPDHSGISEEEILVIGMCFDSLPQAQKFYANYAKKAWFVTKVKNTNFDKTRKESKIPINHSTHYTREGYWKVEAATQTNRITVTRCRKRIYVMLDREKESWIVSRLELRYFHPCSANKSVDYHKYRELTTHAKCVITDNNEAGIRPNNTYLALANEVGGFSNLNFSEKDVRNYITSKLRCVDKNADFKEMMNYFMRMKDINPNFFYVIDADDANKFKSTLWVDARHGLLFASFIGVNHHGKSTHFGCALLGSEEIPSFEWVFTWCIWHILKKSQSKLGGYARYRELNAKMSHTVKNSPSVDSFDVDWSGFIKEFDLGQKRWLSDLYANRQKWIPILFKDEFWPV
nr:protein FAR1-RELATED SEQUENCE 5-like [Arachis hypogaea]